MNRKLKTLSVILQKDEPILELHATKATDKQNVAIKEISLWRLLIKKWNLPKPPDSPMHKPREDSTKNFEARTRLKLDDSLDGLSEQSTVKNADTPILINQK